MDNESFNGDRTEIRIEGLSYAYSTNAKRERVSLVVSLGVDLSIIINDLVAHGFTDQGSRGSLFDGSPVIVVTAERAIPK